MLPLTDPQAASLLGTIAEDQRPLAWWLVQRDGTPVAGDYGGGIALLAEVHGLSTVARLLNFLRLSPAVDALDRLVALQRGRLSGIVPDGLAPYRYP